MKFVAEKHGRSPVATRTAIHDADRKVGGRDKRRNAPRTTQELEDALLQANVVEPRVRTRAYVCDLHNEGVTRTSGGASSTYWCRVAHGEVLNEEDVWEDEYEQLICYVHNVVLVGQKHCSAPHGQLFDEDVRELD